MLNNPKASNLKQLRNLQSKYRELLNDSFSKSELVNLCFELGVDYENLPGETKEDKARELILYVGRRNQFAKLREIVKGKRSGIKWPEAPENIPYITRHLAFSNSWLGWTVTAAFIMLFTLTVIALVFGLLGWFGVISPPLQATIGKETSLLSLPENQTIVLARLSPNQPVNIIGQLPNTPWLLIETNDGLKGWIPKDSLQNPPKDIPEVSFPPTPTPTNTLTPTSRPTSTPSPTNTATPEPTQTPPFSVAGEDEILIIVSKLEKLEENVIDLQPRIYGGIQTAMSNLTNINVRLEQYESTLLDRKEINVLHEQFGSTLIVWGYYSNQGVTLRFAANPRTTTLDSSSLQPEDIIAPELGPAFDIYVEKEISTDAAFIGLFTLAQALQATGHYDEATQAYTRAINSLSDLTLPGRTDLLIVAYTQRGIIFDDYFGQHEVAQSNYQKAIQLEL